MLRFSGLFIMALAIDSMDRHGLSNKNNHDCCMGKEDEGDTVLVIHFIGGAKLMFLHQ